MKLKHITILLFVPIINTIVLITTPFLGKYHFGYIEIPFYLTLIFTTIIFLKIRELYTIKMILISFLYYGLLIFFSSHFISSLEVGVKYLTSIGMFIVSYSLIKNETQFYKLIRVIFYCFLLLVIIFVISQYLDIGSTVYDSDIYLPGGSQGVYITNILAYYSLLLPVVFQSKFYGKRFKLFYFLLAIISLFILILVFRRSSLLAFAMGFLLIFLLGIKSKKIFRLGVLFAVLALISSPFLFDFILEGLQSRGGLEDMTNESFARFKEFQLAMNTLVDFELKQFLFGNDVFNYHLYLGLYRRIHNDFTSMFLSSGIIGLLIFIGLHLSIVFDLIRKKVNNQNKIFRITAFSLLTATVIISLANELWSFTSLSVAFFNLGMLVKMAQIEG